MKDPEDNDCLRCCVAYFLGRDPATVPNFVVRYPRTWVVQMCKWVRKNTCLRFVGHRPTRNSPALWRGEAPHIAICAIKGSRKRWHAVCVGEKGIIFDPSTPPYKPKELRAETQLWFVCPPLPLGSFGPRKAKT